MDRNSTLVLQDTVLKDTHRNSPSINKTINKKINKKINKTSMIVSNPKKQFSDLIQWVSLQFWCLYNFSEPIASL
jgi:hypothetical protein